MTKRHLDKGKDMETTCPTCDGLKHSQGIVTRTSGCTVESVECSTCHGSGSISEKHAVCIQLGKEMKARRQEKDLSLREAAEALSIHPRQLSQLEHGVVEAWEKWRE